MRDPRNWAARPVAAVASAGAAGAGARRAAHAARASSRRAGSLRATRDLAERDVRDAVARGAQAAAIALIRRGARARRTCGMPRSRRPARARRRGPHAARAQGRRRARSRSSTSATHGAAFSLAYRMSGTRSAAEDVVQEAFLSLWRTGARYDRARGSVRTWILGIVHHRAIDALRRASVHDRRRASDEGIEERFEAARAHRRRGRAPRRGRARSAPRWTTLPRRAVPRHRARLLRRLHPHRDRRRCSTTPVGTVKGRMRLGLQKMRDQLGGRAEAAS